VARQVFELAAGQQSEDTFLGYLGWFCRSVEKTLCRDEVPIELRMQFCYTRYTQGATFATRIPGNRDLTTGMQHAKVPLDSFASENGLVFR
jgi:hypothetical protein